MFQNKRVYQGLVLISLSPLVHPNGIYFLVAVAIYIIVNFKAIRRRPFSKLDSVFLAIALLLWVSYIVYVGANWSVFLSDMAYQFGRKGERDLIGTILMFSPIVLVLVLAWRYSIKNKLDSIFLFYLIVPLFIINRIGLEMFYQIFDFTFLFIFTFVLIDIAAHFLEHKIHTKQKFVKIGQVVIFTGLLIACYLVGIIGNPATYPGAVNRFGMKISHDTDYINEADIVKVRDFLLSNVSAEASADKPLVVQFYPRADALFFQGLSEKILFSNPVFSNRTPNIYLIHVSKHIPLWVNDRVGSAFKNAGIIPKDTQQILFQRDETEVWYYRVAEG